jgi:hypothetical protein
MAWAARRARSRSGTSRSLSLLGMSGAFMTIDATTWFSYLADA